MQQVELNPKLDFFYKNGYVILEQVIPHELIDNFAQDFDELLQQNQPLKINLFSELLYWQDLESETQKEQVIRWGRFLDIEKFSLLCKELIFHPEISSFLTDLYQGNKPTNLQTLTYKYSSQQGEHSDKYLVSPTWAGEYNRNSLTAAWIALEAADENNGALIIYPGSHLIKNKKRLIEDFNNNYEQYVNYCQQICQEHNLKPQYFYAKKGDVLFWHGDFIHAGGAIKDWTKSRFSIVCHYGNMTVKDNFFSKKKEHYGYQRVLYQNLGYFHQDLPLKHLKPTLLEQLFDKIFTLHHKIKTKIIRRKNSLIYHTNKQTYHLKYKIRQIIKVIVKYPPQYPKKEQNR